MIHEIYLLIHKIVDGVICIALSYGICFLLCSAYLRFRDRLKRIALDKDVHDLWIIATDFIPDEICRVTSISKNKILETFFALLSALWFCHLKRLNKSYEDFSEKIKMLHPDSYSIFKELMSKFGFELFYNNDISYSVNWCARHLTTSEENVKSLSNLFGNLATDFIKANKL